MNLEHTSEQNTPLNVPKLTDDMLDSVNKIPLRQGNNTITITNVTEPAKILESITANPRYEIKYNEVTAYFYKKGEGFILESNDPNFKITIENFLKNLVEYAAELPTTRKTTAVRQDVLTALNS